MKAKVLELFEDLSNERTRYDENATYETDSVQRMHDLATGNNKRALVIVKPDFSTFKKPELQEYATLENVEYEDKDTVAVLIEKIEDEERAE